MFFYPKKFRKKIVRNKALLPYEKIYLFDIMNSYVYIKCPYKLKLFHLFRRRRDVSEFFFSSNDDRFDAPTHSIGD